MLKYGRKVLFVSPTDLGVRNLNFLSIEKLKSSGLTAPLPEDLETARF